MSWVFHRVEVIEVTVEFIEAVDCGQKLVEIAKVVLTELPCGITLDLSAVAMVAPHPACRSGEPA